MEFSGALRLILLAFVVDSIHGEALETPPPISEYLGYRVTLSCRLATEGNDGWLFIRWKKTTASGGEIFIATLQNNVFVPTWGKDVPDNFKDHVELQKSGDADSYSLNMVIDGLMCTDEGNYTCQAFTENGDLSKTIPVTAMEHPGTPSIPDDTFQAKANDTFMLLCEADVGIPPSTISWSYSLKDQNTYLKILDDIQQVNTKGTGESCSYHGKSTVKITMETRLDGATFMCYTGGELDPTGSPANFDSVQLLLYGKSTTPKPTTTTTVMETPKPGSDTSRAMSVHASSVAVVCCLLVALFNIFTSRRS